MPEPKMTFHAPVPRNPSSLPEASSAPSRARLARPDHSQRSGGTGQSVNTHVVLHALRRWWKLALPASLLLTAAAIGAVWLTFEPQYEAAALLEMNEVTPFVAFEPREGGISKGYSHSQFELIKSPWILQRVVKSENVKDLPEIRKQSDAIEWLTKKVRVDPRGDSNVFYIRYSSPDPETSTLVVNEVTRQYMTAVEYEDSLRSRGIVNILKDQLTDWKNRVHVLRELVEEATLKVSVDVPEQEQGPAEPRLAIGKNPLAELQGRLINVKVEQAMLAARIKATDEEIIEATDEEILQGNWEAIKGMLRKKWSQLTESDLAHPVSIDQLVGLIQRRTGEGPEAIKSYLRKLCEGGSSTIGTRAAESVASASGGTAANAAAAPAKKVKRALTADEKELRDELVERELETTPEVAQLNSQLRTQLIALKKLLNRLVLKEKDPLYKRKLQDIESIKDSIKEAKSSLREQVEMDVEFMLRHRQGEGAIGPTSGEALLARRKDELKRLQVELRGCQIAEENLRTEYSKQLEKTLNEQKQLSPENLNLKYRKDELAEAQAVLARINERLISLQTEQNAPPRVIWHDPAKIPLLPIEVLPIRNMSVAGLAAFFLPFALAVAWEVRARRISSPDDLEQQLHLSVLGEIARLPSRPRTDLRSAETRIGSELRIFEESIDSLRTTLTLSENLRDMRVLAITSAANHEGKTSVASQLAMSLARATGKTTLLIDGDMRSPDVHQVFGVARGPGLAEVLSNECALADAIVATHNPNVQLLPAGRLKVSPHRLLGNGAWKSLLAQIPASYGYVIIDTPPVLAASEALVLSKHADAILICVMRDVSRADQVQKATNLLTAAGGSPVGTVLNGVPIRSYKYYYGTYPSPAASAQA
jgi:capsular exopolysaccharide synthesis family protein